MFDFRLALVLDEDLVRDLVEQRDVPPRAQPTVDNLVGRGDVDVAERAQHDTLSYKMVFDLTKMTTVKLSIKK